MNIRDLRVGNFLHHLDEFIIVKGISEDGVILFNGETHRGYWNDKNVPCKPITLNEDWLIKLGFERRMNELFELNGVKVWHDGTSFYHINSETSTYFEFVHTLQNWFYSVTEEELIMK